MLVHDFLELIHRYDCPCCGSHTENNNGDLCDDCEKILNEDE